MATKPRRNPLQRIGQGIRNLFGDKDPNKPGIQRTAPKPAAAPAPVEDTQKPPPGWRPIVRPGEAPATNVERYQAGAGTKKVKAAKDSLPSAYAGSIDEEGNVTPPDVMGLADVALPGIETAQGKEIKEARGALAQTGADVKWREQQTARDIRAGVGSLEQARADIVERAEAGKEVAGQLPGAVKADVSGIADEYKRTTDVDIGKIESLGREAVGMALDGKNAAAQAAVQAQQGATQNAISQINADPSIPQSRKTAMIAQIQTQSSMQIAATVGANIKDFTALQTGAMTSTMQAVGSAMTARNQSLADLGGAEINAVASAHETAAGLMKGYDDMAASATQNAEQLRYQYNTLRQTARQMNNDTDLQLLGEKFYVAGMPVDFKMTNLQLTRDMLGTDFSMQLQSRGFENMQEAIEKGDAWAQQTMAYSAIAPYLPGWASAGLSFLSMLMPKGGSGGGGQ